MMLDNKSEQKWPLAVRFERTAVKGHFFFTWKKWDLKRDPNKISIPHRRINVKLICSPHAQICILYKYRLCILYSIRHWNIWKLVISYRHKEVTPKHRWNLLRQTLKQPEALNANQQRPIEKQKEHWAEVKYGTRKDFKSKDGMNKNRSWEWRAEKGRYPKMERRPICRKRG